MSILESFKLKAVDLEPIYALWVPPPPTFTGSPKQNVDDWLATIRTGCTERNVPRESWHKVAQHYMSPKAKTRLDELKNVMKQVHGGKYRWNWEKYKIAMRNMGWDIDEKKTETVKVHAKSGGIMWFTRRNSKDEEEILAEQRSPIEAPPRPPKKDSQTKSETKFWLNRRPSKEIEEPVALTEEPVAEQDKARSAPTRPSPPFPSKSFAGTDIFKSMRRGSASEKQDLQRPSPHKFASDTAVVTSATVSRPEIVVPAQSDSTVTTTTQAPVWLMNACNALDFLNNEHPRVMSTVGAILITVGSIPAIPAVAAGAGGAVLASGAAHAVGAIAISIGSWIKMQQDISNGKAQKDIDSRSSGAVTEVKSKEG